jgi:hypothetical protein
MHLLAFHRAACQDDKQPIVARRELRDIRMGLVGFLNALFDSGRVRVGPWERDSSPAALSAAADVLAEREALVRDEFPGDAPDFRPAAALWAATMIHRACQLAVYRDLDAVTMEKSLAAPGPDSSEAANHYSVDIVLQFLPDLTRLAQSAAADDPLVGRLRQWAVDWPYSSVGLAANMPGERLVKSKIAPLVAHPGMLRAYADRVIERADLSRLDDPAVREAVSAALGAFPDLSPAVARALTNEPAIPPPTNPPATTAP